MAVNTLRRGLNRETRALLEHIRRERPVNLVYGMPAQTVIAQAHATIDRVIASSGLAHLVVDELHWFMDDVARALCAGRGEELVFELEGLLGKWLAYDLEPNTVQLLLRILLRNLAGIAVPSEADSNHKDTKTQRVRAESKPPRTPRSPRGGDGVSPQRHKGTMRQNPKSEARMTKEDEEVGADSEAEDGETGHD